MSMHNFMCESGDAPVYVFWITVTIPWEADVNILLKWWLNIGTSKKFTSLFTSAVHHNGTS